MIVEVIVMLLTTREGEDNIWNNPGGLGATGRSFNDDYDSIRISAVPSGIGKLKYHISTISQKPLSFRNPVGNIGNNQQVYYNQTQKFLPCPGAEKVYFNSKSGIRCIYSKTDGSGLRTLYNNKANFKSNQGAMTVLYKMNFVMWETMRSKTRVVVRVLKKLKVPQ